MVSNQNKPTELAVLAFACCMAVFVSFSTSPCLAAPAPAPQQSVLLSGNFKELSLLMQRQKEAAEGDPKASTIIRPAAKPGFSYGFAHTAPLHGGAIGVLPPEEAAIEAQRGQRLNNNKKSFGTKSGDSRKKQNDLSNNGGAPMPKAGNIFNGPAPLPHPSRRPIFAGDQEEEEAEDAEYEDDVEEDELSAEPEGYLATQYHTQSHDGDAAFGYAHPGQAHTSIRDANGGVSGSYSYISPDGTPIHVKYIADSAGFRVVSNALPDNNGEIPLHNNAALPTPVEDTPEVKAAKEEHMRLFATIQASRQHQHQQRLQESPIQQFLNHFPRQQ